MLKLRVELNKNKRGFEFEDKSRVTRKCEHSEFDF